ncbi:unnamed protein product [Rotaria sordida]|uniref:G-patch domain-containing protein n=1 Tax=Rotaria sordida TaxID=392033 RepID=A0A813MWM8_9BILA|nr:unnamed protein product [Rotaria sordida]CAF0730693.1 unnamed protein product [Rotaria sordida]
MSRNSYIEFKIHALKRPKINHNLSSIVQFDSTTISDDVPQEFISTFDNSAIKSSNVSTCTPERSIPVQSNTHHDIFKFKKHSRKSVVSSDPIVNILNNNLKQIIIDESKVNNENGTIDVYTIKQDLSNTLENDEISIEKDDIENADYNEVPIEEFGMAAIRGMGYNENIGLGKSNKKQINIFNPEIRPHGLGLGADREVLVKINRLKRNLKEAGSYSNLYGTIVSINEDLNRIDVKLTTNDDINETISISQYNIKLMLPQLKDFNWYIDMKLLAGANGQRIQQPSCVLSLDINDPTKSDGENEKSVQIELSKETLNLVLDNFTRIREQLNILAKRE